MYTVTPLVESKESPKIDESKKKIDKYNGFNVPSKFHRTARWCTHIYTIIKEARQDKRDDVRIAFNNLVECLNKYKNSYVTSRIRPNMKYHLNIRIKSSDPLLLTHITDYNNDDWDMEPGWWVIKEDFDTAEGLLKIQACRVDIMNTYAPLYELIKRDVIPYMELKSYEQSKSIKSKYYRSRMKSLEIVIKTAENRIEKARDNMLLYSIQYDELQKPPKLTVFD
jgi:hypothetical protein